MPTSWNVTPHRDEHGYPATMTGDDGMEVLDLDMELDEHALRVFQLHIGQFLGGSTDTGSTDTQGPRDGNAGKKSSRSRMRGLLDWRKPRSRGRMPGKRQANGNKARQPPAQATQPRAAGA